MRAILLIAIAIAFAVPYYRRLTSSMLTDQRAVIVKSNSIFPVVSMRVFTSGANHDRVRILILHRRTKSTEGEWGPKWLDIDRTRAGNLTCNVNGKRIYPREDSQLVVVYASDDDDPSTMRVPYELYTQLPWDDTALLWKALVDGVRQNEE